LKTVPAVIADKSDVAAPRCQSKIGVIDAQQEAMLGARGEHPVRLEAPLRDQVVDHDADVGFVAAENERRAAPGTLCGVDPGDDSLPRRLFVTGRAVNLTGEKQPRDAVRLERRFQFRWLDEVIFDRVAGPQHFSLFQSGQRLHQLLLERGGKTHRETIDVDFFHVEAFGFQEQLVALVMWKSHHFVFERRAVPRSDAGNLPIEKRRFVNAVPHELVDRCRCVKDVTRRLVDGRCSRHEGKRHWRVVAMFHVEQPRANAALKINGPPRESWRRAGLEPTPAELKRFDRFREIPGGRLSSASRRPLIAADMNEAIEERAGRDHQRVAAELRALFER
jgi:hypothetical protein